MRRRDFISGIAGSAAVWPLVARAQTAKKRPIIGMLVQGTPIQSKGLRFRQAFLDGLRELGYFEGRDFDIITRAAPFTSELPKAAEQLIQSSPDVIFAAASANALAARQITSSLPLVVGALGNLGSLGLAASDVRRPTGNLTGIMPYVQGLPAKQLELAREIVPGSRIIGIVTDASDIKATPQWDEINAAAAKLEITIVGGDARRPEDIDATFRRFSLEHVDVAIVLQANSLLLDRTLSLLPPRQIAFLLFMDTANMWKQAGSSAMELILITAFIAPQPMCTRYSEVPQSPICPLSSLQSSN